MGTKYYWFCDDSGLMTEDEKNREMLQYGLENDDFCLSDVEITPEQTELEAICKWFQRMDLNGSYTEYAEELRDSRTWNHDKDFLLNIDGLVAVLGGWMSEDWETDCVFHPGYIPIMTRLLKLREEVTR